MNTKDIRTSTDPDHAGSYAAVERAALAAQELANNKNVHISAAELVKMRQKQASWFHEILHLICHL